MFGTTVFMSGLFLSAISALDAMADLLSDNETSRWAKESFVRGKESLEKELWNGDYLRLWHRITDHAVKQRIVIKAGQMVTITLG